MQSKIFKCPRCASPLQMEGGEPGVSVVLWCGNRHCPSDEAANNGGSGPTEEAAYRALVFAVKHEEDRETERECEPLSPEEQRERNEGWKAEHANDVQGSGGA